MRKNEFDGKRESKLASSIRKKKHEKLKMDKSQKEIKKRLKIDFAFKRIMKEKKY